MKELMNIFRDFLGHRPVLSGMPTPILALLLTVLTGCAHGGAGGAKHPPSDQVIQPDARKTSDPLTALEQELTQVHSDRVIVSTALLRSLVKNERLQRTHCKNVSGQLEAIKNIDLEETGEELKE